MTHSTVRMRLHRHMQRLSLRYYADRETGYARWKDAVTRSLAWATE